jgi:hypothetical protein
MWRQPVLGARADGELAAQVAAAAGQGSRPITPALPFSQRVNQPDTYSAPARRNTPSDLQTRQGKRRTARSVQLAGWPIKFRSDTEWSLYTWTPGSPGSA